MENNKKSFWDPLNENIKTDSFQPEQQSVVKQTEKYQHNPNLIKRNLCFAGLVPVISLILLIFFWETLKALADPRIFLCTFIPLILYYQGIRLLQEKLLLYLLCQGNGWSYNPEETPARTQKFIQKYPDIFAQGREQSIDEQIWGSANKPYQIEFWRCTFKYRVGHGRYSHINNRAVFALKLNQSLNVNYTMLRVVNFWEEFQTEIKTESEEFNKKFKVVADKHDSTTEAKVLKVLSPSVQVRFIEFSKKYKLNRIYFEDDIMLIEFIENVWKTKYTNFLKKVAIDKRDVEHFSETLKDMMALPSEMIQYMD